MKITRRTKLLVVALVLCFTTMIGSTVAWFTDSVESANNVIESGNLDMVVEYKTSATGTWQPLTKDTKLFKEGALYEPGYTEVVFLRVANAGNLAFKYNLALSVEDTAIGKSVLGNDIKLSDYLNVGTYKQAEFNDANQYADILLPYMFGDRASALSNVTNTVKLSSKTEEGLVVLDTDHPVVVGEYGSQIAVLVLNMPTTVGNEANHNGTVPRINLGVHVVATQLVSESDSFGNDYDKDAQYPTDSNPQVMYNGTVYDDIYAAVAAANVNGGGTITLLGNSKLDKPVEIASNITIDGNGYTLTRADADTTLVAAFTGTMFTVQSGSTLTLDDTILDGENKEVTGNLIATKGTGSIVLNKGTVLQKNNGANAISLATRGGGSLTVNGAAILYNTSAAGAIWGGGNITINEGSKINYNHATSIGGAIRMVDGYNNITFTMNGGEMNYNTSDSTGGAIWGGNRATYIFNGGEMAYNSAATAGGAIWTGTYENYTISGNFKLHDNSAGELGGAIRFADHASLTMTGGSVYNNTINGKSDAWFLNNNSASITGGSISDDFSYSGGLDLTIGKADITGIIHYNIGTNHKTAYLAKEFNSFKFTVEEAHVELFNLKPAADYTYTDGDEAKLICLNEGYETYWDTTTNTFKLRSK